MSNRNQQMAPKQQRLPAKPSNCEEGGNRHGKELHDSNQKGALLGRNRSTIGLHFRENLIRILHDNIDTSQLMEYDICKVDPSSSSVIGMRNCIPQADF